LPPEPQRPAIVVTATALPDPAAERAYSVETIDKKRLWNAPSTQLDQVLKDVPGLQLFRRSDARSGHPTSQGVTLRALGGNASSRALLVLDGVPQTDPFGGWVNWPAYDPISLSEVRVVRGGGSVANGPGALAGTIEMRSRVAEDLSGGLEVGSRESVEARLFAGLPLGGGTMGISARGARGDGFIPITAGTRGPVDRTAPYKEASVRAYWSVPIGPDVDIQASGLGFVDRRDRGVDFTGNRTNGADASVRVAGRGRWQWSALGYAQWRELYSSFASVNSDRTAATRVALQDSVPSHALGGRFEVRPPLKAGFELRLGGDFRATEGESRELFSYVGGEPTRRRRAGGNSATAGLFAEAAADFGGLTLSGGARLDRWRISDGKLLERVIATGAPLREDRFGERSGWLPTARAGAVFETGGLSLRSAAYLGWRMPTLNELFRPFRAGADATAANPLLDPERLRGAELGVRYDRPNFKLSATAFVNRLSDGIANVTLGHGPGVFPGVGFVGAGGSYRQRQNLDSIRVRGIEASAEVRHGEFTTNLGLSFTDAKVEGSGPAGELDGLRPAQTPRLMLNGGLSWQRGRKSVSIFLRHVGTQFEDDLNQDKLKPATTLDAFTAWPLTSRLQLIVRAENLFDKLVEAGIGGDGSVERATPRTLWIGLRFNSD